VIVVDTAPLVSLIDAGQGETHRKCNEFFQTLRQPLLTTWCCLTEAMYLLHRFQGWSLQKQLWQFVERKALHLHASNAWERDRIYQLMEQYQDVPMDLADASLVAAGEALGIRQVFTLDSDFYIYRLHDQDAFDVVGKE
jgi:predicted nucleic acid-binding protein